jgi:hypothetical protein
VKAKRYVQMPVKCFMKLEKAFKTECCDCGLVHVWVLKKEKGVVGFRIARDNRATGQRRKHGSPSQSVLSHRRRS